MNPTALTPRPPRPGDFLKTLYKPQPHVPDPSKDFGMYQSMDAAFDGLHRHLDGLRSNEGRVGHGSSNDMSDLSKDFITAVQREDEEEQAFISNAMDQLLEGLEKAMSEEELAATGNRFTRTAHQEAWEAHLFGQLWPVVTGKTQAVPALISWRDFPGNVQAYLYGFLDVVSELGKSMTESDVLSNPELTTEEELALFARYLAIADSIALRLSQERHFPAYVTNNGHDRWTAFSKKLRTVYGTIAHIRREYNGIRRMRRMIQNAVQK